MFFIKKSCFIFFIFFSVQLLSQQKRDSLWAVWKNTTMADTARLEALDQMCRKVSLNFMPDSAIFYADQEYAFAKKKNLKIYLGKALIRKGEAYKIKSDYPKYMDYAQQSLKLFNEANYTRGIARSLLNIGNVYMYWGDYEKALGFFYRGLKLFEKTGDKQAQAVTLSNISAVYNRAGKTDSAVSMYYHCLNIYKKANNKEGMAIIYRNLGELYYDLYKPDTAAYYLQKAIPLYIENNNQVGLATAIYGMAKVYYDKRDSVRTAIMLEKSLQMAEKIGDSGLVASCLQYQSFLAHSLRDTDKALKLGRRAISIFSGQGLHYMNEKLAFYMSRWLIEQEKYKEALEMYEFHEKECDIGRKKDAKAALYREQIKYNFEKKELLAKAENERKLGLVKVQAGIKDFRKNLWLTGAFALLVIILLSVGFIYKYYRQKDIIATQKNNILKQQLLVSQMSPHFIFNSLTAIQNFIFKQDSYHAGIYLKQFSELIRMILDFSRRDLITLENEFNFLKNYLELQKLRFGSKLNYELNIDPQLNMDMVLIPPMLAQPFIENAIEHGIFYKDGDGFLSIKISLVKHTLIYEIDDNGIGLGESLKSKKNDKHQSLAIKITKERIETMNFQNNTNFEIEITDKSLLQNNSTGVYVKFATPYNTL